MISHANTDRAFDGWWIVPGTKAGTGIAQGPTVGCTVGWWAVPVPGFVPGLFERRGGGVMWGVILEVDRGLGLAGGE